MPARVTSGLPLRVQWRLDGITFNGPPDEHGREWVIETETGWSDSPPVRADQQQARSGAHGAWPTTVYRDARSIRLDGWVYAPTWEARRDAEHRLAALCSTPGKLYELHVTEELGDLLARVTQDDTTLVNIRPGGHYLDFSLQLTAPDPRRYAVAEQTAATGLPSDSATGLDFGAGGGAGLDFSGPGLDFGPQTSTGRATVTNHGTADTAPRFTLTGPLVPPITITRTDGTRVTYRDQLAPGEHLVIDIKRRVVHLHGTTNTRHRAVIADWDALTIPPKSTVDHTLVHSHNPNTTARLHIAWHSAWW